MRVEPQGAVMLRLQVGQLVCHGVYKLVGLEALPVAISQGNAENMTLGATAHVFPAPLLLDGPDVWAREPQVSRGVQQNSADVVPKLLVFLFHS